MAQRLEVTKTYKLFIDGRFPRSESGRTIELLAPKHGEVLAHVCRASRKDVRDAVSAARKAQPAWYAATAYLRGQILYRMAEMIEGKREEFVRALNAGSNTSPRTGTKKQHPTAESQVQASIDRMVCFAGWADKFSQVLGCNNAVAGPYYNFTIAEPTGVVAVVSDDHPALLSLITLIAPALCSGNTVVALAGEGTAGSLAGVLLGEVAATSDVPPGVLNILTGTREELAPVLATHRDIDAIHAGLVEPPVAESLRRGVAENLKRVVVNPVPDYFDDSACGSPWMIEPLINFKTIWHPSAV